jgi:hypothetical protein
MIKFSKYTPLIGVLASSLAPLVFCELTLLFPSTSKFRQGLKIDIKNAKLT